MKDNSKSKKNKEDLEEICSFFTFGNYFIQFIILMELVLFCLKLFISTAAILEILAFSAEAIVAFVCYYDFITFTISQLI